MFWFRLARELGMSVARCQQEVSSAEFVEWMAYSGLELFGPEADDLRAGTLAAAIYNVNRNSKRRPKPFGVIDVFPWFGLASRPDTAKGDAPLLLPDPVEQTALMKAALFGKRRRKGKP
ncbi:hypothetical protein [Paraburkholderia sp. J8-2]|uniref:phage tail assembly protein T n=1 Tax=Paraburkholderia sp. J8-2 TaxID=2805440 RepID=UPI002AB6F933|nr:hypothetical protein [Paraburkholderia sp. J8-2]